MLLRFNTDDGRPDAPAGRAWVHLPPADDHGGRDIRVVAPDGRPVSFDVAHAAPDGRYLLGFEIGARDGFYAVYYDNPGASAGERSLPARGLIYETRPMPPNANPENWPAAQKLIKDSQTACGADYWERVFDGYNPFGPQSGYVAIYHGYINCPRDGAYKFSTMSERSSFLLVDDQVVTDAIGRLSIWSDRRGQHQGSVQLRKGTHKFRYVTFVPQGGIRWAAAWTPPGKEWWEIIPPGAFLPLSKAEVRECERYGQHVCADFTCRAERYCEAGGAAMVGVRFESTSTATGDLIQRYEWDFGDGQVASGARASHVFLEPGLYGVKLTVTSRAGRKDVSTKKVSVEPVWTDQNFTLGKMDQFFQAIRGYRLDRLPLSSLLSAWKFASYLEKDDVGAAAGQLLDGRRGELGAVQLHELAMYLGGYYRDRERRYDLAEEYFSLARDSVPESDQARRLDARFALCDLHFYALDDPERARGEYVELRADFPRADPARRRRALIRIGDTYRHEDNLEEALAAYREAEEDPKYVPEKPGLVVESALFHEVESYLLAGEGEEALKRLEELLWYYPTMRLEGRPALLRVRAELLKGDFREAKQEADVYVRVGRDPNFLPAVHVRAAEACIELGLIDEAVGHYRTVLDKFPEAPEVQDAENGLVALGK